MNSFNYYGITLNKKAFTFQSLPELHKVLTDGGQGLVYEDPGTGIESTLKIIGQGEKTKMHVLII